MGDRSNNETLQNLLSADELTYHVGACALVERVAGQQAVHGDGVAEAPIPRELR